MRAKHVKYVALDVQIMSKTVKRLILICLPIYYLVLGSC